MGVAYPVISDRKLLRAFDVGVVLWIIIWVTMSIATFIEVRSLRQLSTTLMRSSDVLADTADVLGSIEDVPLVGSEVEEVHTSVRAAAESARASGLESRDNISDLSILLGVVIFLVPVVPVLFLYLPLRLAWKREVAAISSAIAASGDDPTFKEFLARRATQNLGFHRLQELGINPWRALESERYEELSKAELERLGIDPDHER